MSFHKKETEKIELVARPGETFQCAKSDPPRKTDERKSPKLGYRGTRMRPSPEELSEACHWRKVFLRGVRMRRNIVGGNYEGYRIYANSDCPVAKLDPGLPTDSILYSKTLCLLETRKGVRL